MVRRNPVRREASVPTAIIMPERIRLEARPAGTAASEDVCGSTMLRILHFLAQPSGAHSTEAYAEDDHPERTDRDENACEGQMLVFDLDPYRADLPALRVGHDDIDVDAFVGAPGCGEEGHRNRDLVVRAGVDFLWRLEGLLATDHQYRIGRGDLHHDVHGAVERIGDREIDRSRIPGQ